MFNLTKDSIIFLVISCFIGGGVYIVNDYFNLRSAYKMSQNTVKLLEKNRKMTDKVMVDIERDQNVIHETQDKYLLEMDRHGYIHTNNGKNPAWMQYKASTSSR